MTTAAVIEQLKTRFPDKVSDLSTTKGDPFIFVKADTLVEVCRYLKSTAGLDFDYCQDITAIDWPSRNVIEVVYHLFSMKQRHSSVVKVELDRTAPSIATVESVWKAATWLEREVFDLFGVNFIGHSDLRRILLPDDWVGYPLRKDYTEAGGYHGIDNVRPDPLVQLTQRTTEARAAIVAAAPPPSPVAQVPATPVEKKD
jgi:NADH-quinone oxidoreductase subunit C